MGGPARGPRGTGSQQVQRHCEGPVTSKVPCAEAPPRAAAGAGAAALLRSRQAGGEGPLGAHAAKVQGCPPEEGAVLPGRCAATHAGAHARTSRTAPPAAPGTPPPTPAAAAPAAQRRRCDARRPPPACPRTAAGPAGPAPLPHCGSGAGRRNASSGLVGATPGRWAGQACVSHKWRAGQWRDVGAGGGQPGQAPAKPSPRKNGICMLVRKHGTSSVAFAGMPGKPPPADLAAAAKSGPFPAYFASTAAAASLHSSICWPLVWCSTATSAGSRVPRHSSCWACWAGALLALTPPPCQPDVPGVTAAPPAGPACSSAGPSCRGLEAFSGLGHPPQRNQGSYHMAGHGASAACWEAQAGRPQAGCNSKERLGRAPHQSQGRRKVLQQPNRLLPRLPVQPLILEGCCQLGGAPGMLQASAVAAVVCSSVGRGRTGHVRVSGSGKRAPAGWSRAGRGEEGQKEGPTPGGVPTGGATQPSAALSGSALARESYGATPARAPPPHTHIHTPPLPHPGPPAR